MSKNSRPPLGTQHRTVYDYAEEWHDNEKHKGGDVRKCTDCRSGSSRSPYKVMLNIFFTTDGEMKDPRERVNDRATGRVR